MTRLACQTITWGDDRLNNDYPAIIRQVRNIGYDGVETKFAVLRKYAGQLAALRASTGVLFAACHMGFADVQRAVAGGEVAAAVESVLEASGAKFILVSDEPHESVDTYRTMGETLTRFAERVLDFNVRVLFHNHRREVEGNMERLATLVAHSAADRVGLAVDFGWVLQAGTDPLRVVDQFRDRIGYVHLKDALADGAWTELGNGKLAIDTVVTAIRPLNLPWWTAEQDSTGKTPDASAEDNFRFLSALLR